MSGGPAILTPFREVLIMSSIVVTGRAGLCPAQNHESQKGRP